LLELIQHANEKEREAQNEKEREAQLKEGKQSQIAIKDTLLFDTEVSITLV